LTIERRRAWIWTAVALVVCGAYQVLAHFVLVTADGSPAGLGAILILGLPHAAINSLLVWVFGRTLRGGREPLITAFARKAHRTLPPFLEAYTRRVTAAWCAVSALQLILSAALFIWASLEAWSLFVSVLSLVLVVAMFVGEYVYRVLRYPNYPHVSIWAGIRMFVERGSAPVPETPPALPNVPSNG
jgi:uncharacterized membrane protein